MKTLTVDPKSNIVYVDGEGRKVDCSGVPDDIHAIQWDEAKKVGWIEYDRDPNAKPWEGKPHKTIKSRAEYDRLMSAWETVVSNADVVELTTIATEVINKDLLIQDYKKAKLPVDGLETERDSLLARKQAIESKYASR